MCALLYIRLIYLVYLVIEKREGESIKCYKWLRGAKYDPQYEIADLKREDEENEKAKVSFWQVLKLKATQRAFFIGIGLMFFQQMCGINVVIFNSTAIFQVSFRPKALEFLG